jgi:predicted alpha/beta hydrolase family esterase
MAASGQLQLLAQEVLKRVQRSGQKAIIIAHSHGATVALQLLQEPAL